MLLQNRDALGHAFVAYIGGSSRHKTPDIGGTTAAERATQFAPQKPAEPYPRGISPHVLIPDSRR
jgi:hypothetical protein